MRLGLHGRQGGGIACVDAGGMAEAAGADAGAAGRVGRDVEDDVVGTRGIAARRRRRRTR